MSRVIGHDYGLRTNWLSCSPAEKHGMACGGSSMCGADARLSKSQQCPSIADEIMLGYIRRSIGRRLKDLFFPLPGSDEGARLA